MPEKNITYEIQEHFGVLASYESGWNKELNLVCWNGSAAKFDIRDWDEHHERMSRGVTLSPREMRKMVDLYVARNNEIAVERGRAIEAERSARREAAMKKREEEMEAAVENQQKETETDQKQEEAPF